MSKLVLAVGLLSILLLGSACSTTEEHPAAWHSATDTIRVYAGDPDNSVELRVSDAGMTVLRAVGESRLQGDLSRVSVLRGTGTEAVRVDLDVREMILTGMTTHNILLRPGDVVCIGG